MQSQYTHRIIVNESGQVQVTRLKNKRLIHSTGPFNGAQSKRVVYCTDLSDDLAKEMGRKLADETTEKRKTLGHFAKPGKKGAASHLYGFAVAAYLIVAIFFLLVLVVR